MLLAPATSCSWPAPLTTPTRNTLRIVHHALDVKGWIAAPPSAASARPGSCVDCGAASQPIGGRIGLHGHGFRDRQLRGPPDVDHAPTWIVLTCRRYRCTSCAAILTVVPRGVAPRRHYGHAAIAMALTLWGIVQEPTAEVRRRVCASPVSAEDIRRWPTLRRWARAARDALDDASLSLRAAASRAAQVAIGHAPPSLRTAPRWHQAFAGGSAMR